MGYSSKISPYLSRKTYCIVCEWWSRSTFKGQLNLSKLAYDTMPSGTFHAKPSSQFSYSKRNISDMRFSNNVVSIETPDDISGLRNDDLVRYNGILYRVDSIVKREITKTREFMRAPLSVFVLQLIR